MTKTHGHLKTINGKQVASLTYNSWKAMKYRCSPNAKDKPYYEGIEICREWVEDFRNFLNDMGLRPNAEYSIDRIDGTKGYYKENCRWATKKEQAQNVKSNVFAGTSVDQKCKDLGIERGTFDSRRKRGYSIEEALSKEKYKVGHDGDAVRGEKNVNAKLTEEDILEIRRIRKEENLSFEKIGRIFGVTGANVKYIVHRQTWKHI